MIISLPSKNKQLYELADLHDITSMSDEEMAEATRRHIYELCAYGGISKGEIAKRVGLSRVSIWRIQNGKHKTTKFEHGVRIANLHAMIFQNKKKNTA